jgi:hypothetical protein
VLNEWSVAPGVVLLLLLFICLHCRRINLDSQTMAALGTTGGQDSTTTASTRANEETVGTLATDDGRLIGTFHIGDSPEFNKVRRMSRKTRD